jgi:hypothetical protein
MKQLGTGLLSALTQVLSEHFPFFEARYTVLRPFRAEVV